jgi:hypothetical protein
VKPERLERVAVLEGEGESDAGAKRLMPRSTPTPGSIMKLVDDSPQHPELMPPSRNCTNGSTPGAVRPERRKPA